MRKTAIVAMIAAAALMAGGSLFAQAKPNFSGKWTLVPDPNAMGGGGGGRGGRGGMGGGRGGAVGGQEFTIEQDAKTLKVTRMQGETPYTLTYALDGSESKNTAPGRQGGGPGTESVTKAMWEGNTLVLNITQTMNMQGQSITLNSKQVLSLAADGSLVVETTSAGMRGGEPMTTKTTYKKG